MSISVSFQNTSGYAHSWEIVDGIAGADKGVFHFGVEQILGPLEFEADDEGEGVIRYRCVDPGYANEWQERQYIQNGSTQDLY